MRKFKLLKDVPSHKKGALLQSRTDDCLDYVFFVDGNTNYGFEVGYCEKFSDWFEEIKEEPKILKNRKECNMNKTIMRTYELISLVNSECLIKDLEDTKALIMSIEICGQSDFDIWYTCRWFINGKPVTERFLKHELILEDVAEPDDR